jgi:hypothetical protein
MLTLAALIFAGGSVSANVTRSHGTFPQSSRGSIVATGANIERKFPPKPKLPPQWLTLLAAQQERNQEERQLCRVTTGFGTTFYTSLPQRECLQRPEALTKY